MIKLKANINLDDFFSVIDKCDGEVNLVGEDLYLRLKSVLARYFAWTQLLQYDHIRNQFHLELNCPEDVLKLSEFIEED